MDGDGKLSITELVAILQRGAGPDTQSPEEAQRTAEGLTRRFDVNADGGLRYDEFVTWWASVAKENASPVDSPTGGRSSDAVASSGTVRQSQMMAERPPPTWLELLIKAGTVVPDEGEGPYALDMYHSNVTGLSRGYKEREGHEAWFVRNEALLARHTSWESIEPETMGGMDVEWLLAFGTIDNLALPVDQFRPRVIDARSRLRLVFLRAYEKARTAPGAAAAIARIAKLRDKMGGLVQPGGKELTVLELYQGALSAAPALWRLGERAVEASGEQDVWLSWAIKQFSHVWFELNAWHDGDVSRVTDCVSVAVVLATAQGLESAALRLYEQAGAFQNRLAKPTAEGYRELVFTVRLAGGHVGEVRLHLAPIADERSVATERVCAACRRVLVNPVVDRDSYCRKVVGGKPTGSGGLNTAGEPEGDGTMVYADGDVYTGQWRGGLFDGQGTHTFTGGDKYVGGYRAGLRHGKGTMFYASGDRYEGGFKEDLRSGLGTYTYSGGKYVGLWEADMREGEGTDYDPTGNTYVGQWKKDCIQGKGTNYYADGNTYEGGWKDGLFEGHGTYHYAGEPACTPPHTSPHTPSLAHLTCSDEHSLSRPGYSTMCLPLWLTDGSKYVGDYREDMQEGEGTYHYADGNRYEGGWLGGEQSGTGLFHYAQGMAQVSNYEGGVGVGQGAWWSADRTEACRLQNGEPVEMISLDEAAQIAHQLGRPVPKLIIRAHDFDEFDEYDDDDE